MKATLLSAAMLAVAAAQPAAASTLIVPDTAFATSNALDTFGGSTAGLGIMALLRLRTSCET